MPASPSRDRSPSALAGSLLVADSFRVRTNPRTGVAEVRGLDRHRDRFARSVLACWPGAAEREAEMRPAVEALIGEYGAERGTASFICSVRRPEEERLLRGVDAFLDDALARIAEYGEGFPRLELRGDGDRDPELGLALRPLPELHDTIELRTAGHVGVERAGVKGPNISRYSALNRELGAEALLLDPRGRVLEGTTTSLVWWTDGGDGSGHYVDEPWGSNAAADRVGSITEELLREAAQKRLVGRRPNRRRTGALSAGRPTPAELSQHEVWAVNALHGIRVVTRIDDVALPAPDADRLRWFRDALDRAWQPLTPRN
ncbi:hypothetical protein JD276_04080 [Leucobacter sp. CSA1]|uniref:Branched-chain amino acid aminotransferase/4-amino-4-deoxychorismate lyase n=1 Tax=Leucobacter chromiisoli TaxID=2796471 RepID=A0A934Q7Z0_9MICO|nr:hypothetical protein [Leucobacter chromiisoli]MBK0418207.1 hypothetical protein [Leucobacter chromiisoli]